MDNHNIRGINSRGLDLPHEGDVFFAKKIGLAGVADLVSDTGRPLTQDVTSKILKKERLRQQVDGIVDDTKYPVESPGFGTSSREAISQSITKEKFDCQSEKVGDDTY